MGTGGFEMYKCVKCPQKTSFYEITDHSTIVDEKDEKIERLEREIANLKGIIRSAHNKLSYDNGRLNRGADLNYILAMLETAV
jgi:hypothetical protein